MFSHPDKTIIAALEMYQDGKQIRAIAAELSVHESTVTRWLTKYFFM